MANADLELKKLLDNIRKLPEKLNKSIINLGVKAAAKTVQEAARKNVVPEMEGHSEERSHNMEDLEDAITVKKRSTRSSGKGTTMYSIGIKLDGTAWFAHLVEYGSKIHTPQPFMTPAFEQNGREAINAMSTYIRKRFDRAVKKGIV